MKIAQQPVHGHRVDNEHVEKRRQPQTKGSIAHKPPQSFAIECARDKISRNEKQKPHKERLQKHLVGSKNCRDRDAGFGILHKVPAAQVAVGDGGVHADNQNNHDPAKVINKLQPGFGEGYLGYPGRDLQGWVRRHGSYVSVPALQGYHEMMRLNLAAPPTDLESDGIQLVNETGPVQTNHMIGAASLTTRAESPALSRSLAHDLVLPTLLFMALGGMTWAVRGSSGFGAVNGCVFAGVTWGTAWWFISRDPGARQGRRYSSGWIILAL